MLDRLILDALPVGIWVAHVPGGEVAYANQEFRNILGQDAESDSGIDDAPTTYGIVDLEDRPYPVERLPFSQVVATGRPVTVDDLVIRRADGRRVNVRAFAYPIRTGDTLTHVAVAFIDITAEVRAESGRRQTESRLAFAVDHAPIAIWSADLDGRITLSEGAGLAALGVKSGELVGHNIFELYKDHPSIVGSLRRGLAGESFWYTVRVGEAIYDTWLAPLTDAAGQIVGVTGLSNDVRALWKLQATAIQNDRGVALGTLAASVAHEINNPLTYILGHASLMAESLNRLEQAIEGLSGPAGSELRQLVAGMRESLEPVQSGTSRIADITRELSTFGRPAKKVGLVDVQAAIKAVLRLVGKQLESRAVVEVDLAPTSAVHGDQAGLVQVILNLMINAMHALPADRVTTNRIWVRAADEGNRVVIEVADNGPGVLPEDRDRIFEPFQTTKEVGEGSGLGLFVCRNIVSGWSGTVTVEGRDGGGARFRVELPAAGDAIAAVTAAPAGQPASSRGHVMIVDDEPLVAKMLRVQLAAAGYRVTVAADAEHALETLTGDGDGIDLVYCDLMMKGMSGMDFSAALASQAPSRLRRVVFMTGGAFTQQARDFRSAHADRCVDKPFDVVAETSRRLAGPL
jgi:PAS domain S-box-containing protein